MTTAVAQQNYLSDEGRKKLTAQLNYLENTLRPDILDKLESAADGGDSIENSELIFTLQELDMLDQRIAFVRDTLRNSAPIIRDLAATDMVTLGSSVTIEIEDEGERTYMIVGSAESDPENGSISNRSPLGIALMGKRVGESAIVVNRDFSYQAQIIQIE